MPAPRPPPVDRFIEQLLGRARRLLVLSGAGLSTGSGIPDYRDRDARWKRVAPLDYRDFVREPGLRQRYWARSLVGWPTIASSLPNPGHFALARMEAAQWLSGIVTQNVDGLHQRAGSRIVIDLHGRLDTVRCLRCEWREPRSTWQRRLSDANPSWSIADARIAPDGDADYMADFERFTLPGCPACSGLVKPDVVFYGESVPAERLAQTRALLAASDAVLVVGSSLMVLSGLRHVREAQAMRIPVFAINLGRTRADPLFTAKIERDCSEVLVRLADAIG